MIFWMVYLGWHKIGLYKSVNIFTYIIIIKRGTLKNIIEHGNVINIC